MGKIIAGCIALTAMVAGVAWIAMQPNPGHENANHKPHNVPG
jgi:hypothetical protein